MRYKIWGSGHRSFAWGGYECDICGREAVKQPWKSHHNMTTVTEDRDRSSRYLAMIQRAKEKTWDRIGTGKSWNKECNEILSLQGPKQCPDVPRLGKYIPKRFQSSLPVCTWRHWRVFQFVLLQFQRHKVHPGCRLSDYYWVAIPWCKHSKEWSSGKQNLIT